MTLGFKTPALQGFAVLVTALSGCGAPQANTERSHTAGSDSTAAEGEVAISATVEGAESEGFALSAAVIDYKLTVRCNFARQQLEKIYTAAELAAASATMPKGATGCYAFPSEVRLGPAPEIVFLPPAPAIGATSAPLPSRRRTTSCSASSTSRTAQARTTARSPSPSA